MGFRKGDAAEARAAAELASEGEDMAVEADAEAQPAPIVLAPLLQQRKRLRGKQPDPTRPAAAILRRPAAAIAPAAILRRPAAAPPRPAGPPAQRADMAEPIANRKRCLGRGAGDICEFGTNGDKAQSKKPRCAFCDKEYMKEQMLSARLRANIVRKYKSLSEAHKEKALDCANLVPAADPGAAGPTPVPMPAEASPAPTPTSSVEHAVAAA